MKQKPRLSFWQIWNMSFGFFGIQFGFALQNANVSRIFESLGASVENIPILWIAAPVTGLIIQPIIGHMSDNTWNRLGRRRPYFLVGAILASIALMIMPNSPVLWVAAGMLWIMDASINISMEPFRAFVGDMLSSEQRTKGFAMQSFFIGTGAVIASALPYVMTNWFGVSTVPNEGQAIPPNVKWSFYAGGFVFFLAVLWTVLRTREYYPEELAAFDTASKEHTLEAEDQAGNTERVPRFLRSGMIWLLAGGLLSLLFYWGKALICPLPWSSLQWSSFSAGLPCSQCGYILQPVLPAISMVPVTPLLYCIMKGPTGLVCCLQYTTGLPQW
jgi:maltose/moltooligosaccharide transporter